MRAFNPLCHDPHCGPQPAWLSTLGESSLTCLHHKRLHCTHTRTCCIRLLTWACLITWPPRIHRPHHVAHATSKQHATEAYCLGRGRGGMAHETAVPHALSGQQVEHAAPPQPCLRCSACLAMQPLAKRVCMHAPICHPAPNHRKQQCGRHTAHPTHRVQPKCAAHSAHTAAVLSIAQCTIQGSTNADRVC